MRYLAPLAVCRSEDFGRAGPQRGTYADEIKKTYVPLSSFNLAHVTSINLCRICQGFLGDALELAASSNRCANRYKMPRIVIFTTKSHPQIIKESGKIGHGIYASILSSRHLMSPKNDDLIQLKRDVLDRSPSAALPSNLPDRWLDAALRDVEQVVSATGEAGPEFLRVPLNLVLHLLDSRMKAGPLELSDEQLLHCIKRYRFELAMEKLRRWGVRLAPPATEATIFLSVSFARS